MYICACKCRHLIACVDAYVYLKKNKIKKDTEIIKAVMSVLSSDFRKQNSFPYKSMPY